ncbi:MAG: lysophospholipid acyltransferase family protein [Pirellulaceae bacterium]
MSSIVNPPAQSLSGLEFVDGQYSTQTQQPGWFARSFPSMTFHCRFLRRLWRAGRLAKRGLYDDSQWVESSLEVMRDLESVGVRFEITGVHHVANLDQPYVMVGNHMSTLESIVLPGIIRPHNPVTFVVKSSLLKYPVFRHIIRARDPIVVTRTSPREDFKTVLKGGLERLNRGVSIVIFPQHSRMQQFDPQQFNTIGSKLATRAGVPIIPLALQADAWGSGWFNTDFGRIRPASPVRFAFGPPVFVEGKGQQAHQSIIKFITDRINEWKAHDKLD